MWCCFLFFSFGREAGGNRGIEQGKGFNRELSERVWILLVFWCPILFLGWKSKRSFISVSVWDEDGKGTGPKTFGFVLVWI